MKWKELLNWKKFKSRETPYLKYEEGEVVPVKPKHSNYPPFLDDEEPVKNFRDVQREESKNRENKEKEAGLWRENHSNGNSANLSSSSSESSSPESFLSGSFIMKLFWLVAIGGMVYYSIPMFQYFASKTPDISNIQKKAEETKYAIEETTGLAEDVSTSVKEGTQKAKETLQAAGEVLNQGKAKVEETLNQQTEFSPLSEDEWLTFIKSVQESKQKALLSLQETTNRYANGEIGQSKYRLQVKGVINTANRLNERIQSTIQGQDLSAVKSVIDALKKEVEHLKIMSVRLSSVSGNEIITVFNEEVPTQNELTLQYKSEFKQLLSRYGRLIYR